MAAAELVFCRGPGEKSQQGRPVLIVGQLAHLHRLTWDKVKDKLPPPVHEQAWRTALGSLRPNPTDVCPLWLNSAAVAALPGRVSRHNTPSSAHFLLRLVRSWLPEETSQHIVVVCERPAVFASACALARASPLFSRRSGRGRPGEPRRVTAEFLCAKPGDQPLALETLTCLSNVAESIRLAARIVDTPCSEMSTDDFLQEIREVGSELGIVPSVVRGEELHKKGFGGIYGVGKAARSPPALAVLSHAPEGATQTIAWIGSGIVYNTGGLTLKAKTLMPGAKRDCAGAAAVLGAFRAAVKQGFKENLHAVFCLAENSIGPKATRPDDILRLYSGKTVEVNNTDAGGRLALADGAVYASRDLKADIIVGIGNLTAAQGVVTGRYHAGLLTNSAEWEKACVRAGRTSGDLVHPLVFTPELHISEFSSAMADMKNFVSDRSNAQCSCAGLFLGAHIGFNWSGVWIDVDMGCPAYSGDRATGYGVAFLLALFGQAADDAELQMVSPLGSVADGHVENCEPAGSALKRKRLV
ncbi:probable aminopeptidase NPEPL1 isoform X1 [Lepisosteus oculatus]|uniref:probable aminopeptidase NPEPL1 isoform X1 n=1 Tax=Lepisosteus oculatus TaxID=7918 RepID=UPI00371DDD05